jgi:carboxypeptidase C (cathepsin A)
MFIIFKKQRHFAFFAAVALTCAATIGELGAQGRGDRGERSTAAPARTAETQGDAAGLLRLLPNDSISDHELRVDGRTIAYTATAGTFNLYDQNGERTAAVFYTAYVAKGTDAERRPVTFAFNGGPGAASVYLNLGLAGPRVAEFGDDGRDGAAARLRDNPDSWLTFTDLVMIDPIGTGWSRTAKPDSAQGFWGVRSDANTMAKVIALYLAKNSRSASPKFLLGESYGGFRAAKVATALKQEQGVIVNGLVMVSPMLDAALQWSGTQFALGAALHFPSLAATELDRTKQFTPAALAEAERFAIQEYLPALAGPQLNGEKAAAFYRRVSELTGLPVDVVARSRGWIRNAYLNHMRDRGLSVSSYDAAFAIPNPYPENDGRRGGDPMLDGFSRALSGLFVAHARDELGFKTEMTHSLLASEVASKWDWGDRRNPPSASEDMREFLAQSPSFRILVAHGRSDLVTPYGVSRYVLDRLPDLGGPDRVQMKIYRGGHMFYFNTDARHAFAEDAKNFYQAGP